MQRTLSGRQRASDAAPASAVVSTALVLNTYRILDSTERSDDQLYCYMSHSTLARTADPHPVCYTPRTAAVRSRTRTTDQKSDVRSQTKEQAVDGVMTIYAGWQADYSLGSFPPDCKNTDG